MVDGNKENKMKQQTIDSDKLRSVFETILELIDSIKDKTSRVSIKDMFEDIGERYFSAPASGKVTYHNCFPGGLAEHSLRVYSLLVGLCSGKNIDDDSIIKVALLHDIGKIGDEKKDYYVKQESTWHQDKLGEYYKHNDDIEYLSGAHRSIYLCQAYGIPLTLVEFKAIMIHDGQYVDENSSYKQKEGFLPLLLHMADMIACTIEKENYKKFITEVF